MLDELSTKAAIIKSTDEAFGTKNEVFVREFERKVFFRTDFSLSEHLLVIKVHYFIQFARYENH